MSSARLDLRPPPDGGGHLCCAHTAEDEWTHGTAAFVGDGLARGRRVLYYTDTVGPAAVMDALARGGVDAREAAARGRLVVRSAGDAYLRRLPFDPDRTMALWDEGCAKALAAGYAGLCVVGEMSWCGRDLPGADRLLEYELRLNAEVLPRLPLAALCLYDRRALPGHAVALLTTAHARHVGPGGGGAAACGPPLTATPLEDRTGLCLCGGVDGDTRPVWRAALAALAHMPGPVVHLDLSATDFLDTGAVADLVAVSKARHEQGRRLVLHRPPHSLRRVAEMLPDECGTLETAA